MARRSRRKLSPAEARRRKHLIETAGLAVLVMGALVLCYLAMRK
jgi:hypothetical protein